MRPYTTVLPKPLMPIGDRPVLDVVIRQLHHHGFDRVTIAIGYLGGLIEAFLGDGSRYGLEIDYFRETEPLGTVGVLGLLEDVDTDLLVMNGDILTSLDYSTLMRDHRESGAIATIATQERSVEISLGVLQFDGTHPDQVTGYLEKPRLAQDVSMGVYCFSPAAALYVRPGEHLDFPELVLRLIEADEPVRAWRSDDYWLDIGRIEDYERATADFQRMRGQLLPDEEPDQLTQRRRKLKARSTSADATANPTATRQ